MGVLEIIKRGFAIVHRNIKLFVVLAIFNIISTLARIPFLPATPTAPAAAPAAAPALAGVPVVPTPTSGALIALNLVFGFIGILVFGGILGYVKEFIQTQKSTLVNFIKHGIKFYLRILGIWILITLIAGIFGIVVALPLALAFNMKILVVTVLAVAIALIAGAIGVYIFILLFLSPYVLVVDDIGPVEALKKSANFVRKSLLKMLGLFAGLMLISIGLGFLIGLVTGIASLPFEGAGAKLMMGIVGGVFNAYINVLLPACFLLFYMSSRKAKEPPTAATTQ